MRDVDDIHDMSTTDAEEDLQRADYIKVQENSVVESTPFATSRLGPIGFVCNAESRGALARSGLDR